LHQWLWAAIITGQSAIFTGQWFWGEILVWTVKEVSKETATYASSQDGSMTRRQLL